MTQHSNDFAGLPYDQQPSSAPIRRRTPEEVADELAIRTATLRVEMDLLKAQVDALEARVAADIDTSKVDSDGAKC